MSISLWNVPTGHQLEVIIERSNVSRALPLATGYSDIEIEIISGELPRGTRLEGTRLVGTAFEVATDTVFTCVLRAHYQGMFDDRTLKCVVTGADDPEWLTIGKREYLYLRQTDIPIKEAVFEIVGDYKSTVEKTLILGDKEESINYYNLPVRFLRGELPDNSKNVTLRYGRFGKSLDYNYYTSKTPDGLIVGDMWIDGTDKFSIKNLIINRLNKNSVDSIEILKQFRLTNSDGLLPVGPGNTFFILDNEIIDFQLLATDNDLPAGDELTYFIADGDGELPPGIELTPDGRLTGTTEAILSLDRRFKYGGYDSMPYGSLPLDYSVLPGNGYSTFFYDTQTYDYSENTQSPRKLNRYFPFAVTVTDGDTFVRREFKIYLVGDDYLRSDNTIMRSSTGVFSADVTHVRTPRWITPRNLGFKRANNYTTIYLDILDNELLTGTVSYTLESINDDGTPSELPPGLELDSRNGEIVGRLPYQPAVTENYKFTVRATRVEGAFERVNVFANFYEDVLLGRKEFKVYKLDLTGDIDGISDLKDLVKRQIILNKQSYEVVKVDDSNPDYDVIEVDETIGPNISLLVSRTGDVGDNILFVSRLTESEKDKYRGTVLQFSETEKYTITEITPYIEYEIEHPNLTFFDQEITENLEEDLKSAFGGESYIDKLENDRWRIRVPSTALSRISSKIRDIVTPDDGSSLPAKVTLLRDNEDRIIFNTQLTRQLIKGRNIGIALFKDDFFREDFVVASEDETTMPSTAKTFELSIIGEIDSNIKWLTDSYIGTINANYISTFKVEAETTVPYSNMVYILKSGKLPEGMYLNHYGEIVGSATQFGQTNKYKSTWRSERSYNAGDVVVYQGQKYKAVRDIVANQPESILQDENYFEKFEYTKKGLTVFEGKIVSWDGNFPGDTTFDRQYRFEIEARDRFGFAAITKEFILDVEDLDNTQYTDIIARPMLKPEQRRSYRDLVSNSDIFTPSYIYRPDDENFGIKDTLEMLIFAGIESRKIEEFVAAAAKNHKKKRYKIGSLQKAIAREPGTRDTIYEVVYLPIIDPSEPERGKTRKSFTINTTKRITTDSVQYSTKDDESNRGEGLLQLPVYGREIVKFVFSENGQDLVIDTRNAESINVNVDHRDFVVDIKDTADVTVELELSDSEPQRFRPEPANTVKADSDAIRVSDSKDQTRYISNITNMRDNIKEIGLKQREYLPLWMRTPQEGFQELGYVSAVPICYCKPGTADDIILNIKNSNFDFKKIDFTIDRYIVKRTNEYDNEQFILFANYQFNI